MKKKLIASILAVSMMATLAVGMTLAYFTDNTSKDNTFTVGNVKIELTELSWGGKDGPAGNESNMVYAGEPLDKDPIVTNVGANPCFVRIKVDGLESLVAMCSPSAAEADKKITYRTNYDPGALGADWVDGKDGYFYYTKVLDGTRRENPDLNTSTTKLFDQIVMPKALQGDDNHTDCNVTVIAEAVQAQGAKGKFAEVKQGLELVDLQKWFKDCGMS